MVDPESPIEPGEPKVDPEGIFADPFLYRLAVAFLSGFAGLAVLYGSWFVVTAGFWWATLIALAAIEPLGLFLCLYALALIAPRSRFAVWFQTSKSHVAMLIGLWIVVIGFAIVTGALPLE